VFIRGVPWTGASNKNGESSILATFTLGIVALQTLCLLASDVNDVS